MQEGRRFVTCRRWCLMYPPSLSRSSHTSGGCAPTSRGHLYSFPLAAGCWAFLWWPSPITHLSEEGQVGTWVSRLSPPDKSGKECVCVCVRVSWGWGHLKWQGAGTSADLLVLVILTPSRSSWSRLPWIHAGPNRTGSNSNLILLPPPTSPNKTRYFVFSKKASTRERKHAWMHTRQAICAQNWQKYKKTKDSKTPMIVQQLNERAHVYSRLGKLTEEIYISHSWLVLSNYYINLYFYYLFLLPNFCFCLMLTIGCFTLIWFYLFFISSDE